MEAATPIRLPETPENDYFRLGDWIVVPGENLLEQPEARVTLEPKIMRVLCYMAEHADEVISAEQLLTACWRGTFYGDNPVHKTIAVLRKSLGDDSASPRYIQTIRKRGYRLLAPVSRPYGADQAATSAPRWSDGCPFLGLQAFDENHADVFCGRGRATRQVVDLVCRQVADNHGFVMVVGASGSGKSSLIRAGVIPALSSTTASQALTAAFVAVLDPMHADLIGDLARSMIGWSCQGWPIFAESELADLQEQLRNEPESVAQRVGDALRRMDQHQTQRGEVKSIGVIVIDPLEALLPPAGASDDVQALLHVMSEFSRNGRFAIIAACRSDRYGRVAALPLLAELKSAGGHFDLFPPGPGEIGDMIRLPARAAGLNFTRDPDTGTPLDDALRDAAVQQPDALPLLQHVLKALYEHRDEHGQLSFATYRELGGLEGALSQRADAVLARQAPAVQQCLPSLLHRMVVVDEQGSLSGRSVALAELSVQQEQLARAFVESRLFVSRLVDDRESVAAVHDALWRQWPRVVQWANANRAALHARARLASQTQRWLAAGRPRDLLLSRGLPLEEARSLRQNAELSLSPAECGLIEASIRHHRLARRAARASLAAIVLLGVASGVSGLYAWHARQQAQAQQASAEGLVSFMLGDLASRLQPLGRLDLLDSIGEEALHYLDASPQDEGNFRSVLYRAKALAQLASIESTRGNADAAETSYRKADELLAQLSKEKPFDVEVLQQRGQVSFGLGALAYGKRDLQSALTWFGRYLQDSKALNSLEPDKTQWWLELSYAYSNVGTVHYALENSEAAARSFGNSSAWKRKALAKDPGNGDLQADLANTLAWQGRLGEADGHLADAGALFSEAVELTAKARASGSQDDSNLKFREASARLNFAALETARGELERAEKEYGTATSLFVSLVETEPSNVRWQIDRIHALACQAYLLHFLGSAEQSEHLLRTALQNLAELPPESVSLRRDATEAMARRYLAQVLRSEGALVEAKTQALRALELSTALTPGSHDITRASSIAQAQLLAGLIERDLGAKGLANNWWRASEETLEPFDPQRSSDKRILDPWVITERLLGTPQNIGLAFEALKKMGYADPSFSINE